MLFPFSRLPPHIVDGHSLGQDQTPSLGSQAQALLLQLLALARPDSPLFLLLGRNTDDGENPFVPGHISVQTPGQLQRIGVVGVDSLALFIQTAWGNHDVLYPKPCQLTMERETRRPRFVTAIN